MTDSAQDGCDLNWYPEKGEGGENCEPEESASVRLERLNAELRAHQAELEMQNEELRAAREELEESRDRYAALYDEAPVGYITLDCDCRIEEANLTAADMLGMERTRLLNQNFRLFVARGSRELFNRHYAEVKTNGGRHACKLELNPAGKGRFHASLESVRCGGGEGKGHLCCRTVITDISESRRLLDQLEEERSRLKAVIDSAPEGIVVTDERARILMANSAAERLYDRPVTYGQEMEGPGGLDLRHPDGEPFDPRDLPLSRSALRGETLKRVDMLLHKPGRHKRVLMVSTAPIRDTQGRVRGAVGVFQDFTERKRTADYLRLSEARYKAIVEDIPLFICRYRPDGTVTFVNQVCARYFGVDPEEAIGKNLLSFVPEEYRAMVWDHARSLSEEKPMITLRHPIRTPGGGIRWNRWIGRAIFDHGRLVEYQALGEDITEQHLMQEALRESEERYRAVTRLMTDFAYLFRIGPGYEATLEWAAGPIEEISGYTIKELGTLSRWAEMLYPDDRERVMARVRQCLDEPSTSVDEYRVVTRRGDVRWFRVYTYSVRDEGEGRVAYVYGAARDITERKRAEDAHRESESRLNAFFTDSPVAMAILDEHLRVLRINNTAMGYVGPPEEVCGKLYCEALPALRGEPGAQLTKIVETGDPKLNVEVSVEMPRLSGARVHWIVSLFPVDLSGGKRGLGLIARDITVKKQIEEALGESEKRYRIVSGLTSDYACAYRVFEGAGVRLEWTAGAFTAITGYTREEYNSLGWEAMIHPRDTLRAIRGMTAAIREGTDTVEEFRIVNRAGKTRLLRSYLHPERNPESGKVEWVYAAAQDITERRSLEEKVRRLRREQEALSAHEVKNLLIPLHVYVESLLVASGDTLTEEQHGYLRKLRESTDKAFDFIQYFTKIHELETGMFTLKKTRVPLEDIIRQVMMDLTPVAEKSGVTIVYSSDGGASDFDMDVLLMPGVFTNLILNAIEHVAKLRESSEKTVRVTLSTAENRLIVKIHNRGEPIRPERLATFFERFNPDESKKAGVGLGTTYALLVARAHGGDISVSSSRKAGTTMIVWFG